MSANHHRLRWLPRVMLMTLVVMSLISGIVGGLARWGLTLPSPLQAPWTTQALAWHAALMIGGFLGTVIGIERAVALRTQWAFTAPACSASAVLFLLMDSARVGALLLWLASVAFIAVNTVIVHRQSARHTWLLLLSAVTWLLGNTLFMTQGIGEGTLSAWFAFLVLTIAAERLEMTRLMRLHRTALPCLTLVLGLLMAGVICSMGWPLGGGLMYGLALLTLAIWLATFDIARRTVRAQGLSRYMAICLLNGYAWLAVSGVAWAACAAGWPSRDAALHALGLGFIISMVMGHAPVILPAVAGIKLHFDHRFYAPLGLLNLSLILRFMPGLPLSWHATGPALNAAAIGLFVLIVISAALSWQHQHPTTKRRST